MKNLFKSWRVWHQTLGRSSEIQEVNPEESQGIGEKGAGKAILS